ncbi:3-deoxy-D-manno-octulosonic acid transferase [Wenxinia marina]|uniref:3-deoxy-D-manno-octulosonic acid transferase n=1 Tax=Wenxinia marina DSM 24838 TaxID=1123501 RepID=A0A0D0PA27_9RHOB|nr:glycosyltransferase N-terminal domain-containing protein [Wenxinia marina]KIQ68361.1 3-deoxy-D-manno-octulosonic-acid transferase [Wenxinia marina DSM 24838]
MTLLLSLYRGAADLAAPLAARRVAGRLRAQGVAGRRPWERLGHATQPRPDGPLIWMHGASVGESLSALPLAAALQAERPDLNILVTSGTASSADILSRRLPAGMLHQFAPLDSRPVLRRFLDHWRPDALVLAESEIWPQTILACAARGIPVALVGARLSDGSLRGWARAPRTARAIFSRLALVSAQTAATADALEALGAPSAFPPVDLKAAADPPPGDAVPLAAALGDRPVWAAVSTHPGEEEIALAAHRTVLARHPAALLLLVPRHPERADAIAARTDLPFARRSAGTVPATDHAVWLCDTLGETGLWFRLADPVFLGGSLVPVGGHNPWEPAALGRAPLHGPHVDSAATAWATLAAAGAATGVSADTLGPTVADLLADPARRHAAGAAARRTADAARGDVATLARAILDLPPSK